MTPHCDVITTNSSVDTRNTNQGKHMMEYTLLTNSEEKSNGDVMEMNISIR